MDRFISFPSGCIKVNSRLPLSQKRENTVSHIAESTNIFSATTVFGGTTPKPVLIISLESVGRGAESNIGSGKSSKILLGNGGNEVGVLSMDGVKVGCGVKVGKNVGVAVAKTIDVGLREAMGVILGCA